MTTRTKSDSERLADMTEHLRNTLQGEVARRMNVPQEHWGKVRGVTTSEIEQSCRSIKAALASGALEPMKRASEPAEKMEPTAVQIYTNRRYAVPGQKGGR